MTRQLDALRRSVVKIHTTSDAPDYDQPWQTQGPSSSFGSGAIIQTSRGPRILTNAHVVENHAFVEVRRYGAARKWVAEVEGIGHDCDLALLRVPDERFFRRVRPIKLGKLPALGDEVTVLGFPIGGKGLSMTRGVVSRIELSSYSQSQRQLLAVQIDAAINSGNSGGPVIFDGELAGVAFEASDEGQNIGYMIATPVVTHFLDDMEDGLLTGFPDLGVNFQRLEAPALRDYLGLEQTRKGGVLVREVVYEGSAWGVLEPGDVLLSVDQSDIAADGSVRFRRGERIDFPYLISQRQVGETLPLTVFRRGKEMMADIVLRGPRYLVPEEMFDVRPTYYVCGGLLFVPLTCNYLKTWGDDWLSNAPQRLVSIYQTELATPDRTGVVVLQKVMPDRVNQGYHDLESLVVKRVQDQPVRDLADLIERVESSREKFLRFEADDGSLIALDRTAVRARRDEILTRFGIPADRSADLRVPAKSVVR